MHVPQQLFLVKELMTILNKDECLSNVSSCKHVFQERRRLGIVRVALMFQMFLLPNNSCGFPEVKVIKIAHDICSAIEYLHENHIIHRDIKPGNILLKDHSDLVGSTSF